MNRFLGISLSLFLLSGCHAETSNEMNEVIGENKTGQMGGESVFTIDNYTNTLKRNLELNSDKLIEQLTEIYHLNFYSEVELLDFSTFIEPTRYELSIIMYSMDREANEVFYEGDDPKVFASSINVIDNVVYYEEPTDQRDIFLEFYERNIEEIALAEQEIMKNWFLDCWIKANGSQFKLPSYLTVHDGDKSFDLKNNKWISENEIWSY